jgi:hypothetical protein
VWVGPYDIPENSPAGTPLHRVVLVNELIAGAVEFLKVLGQGDEEMFELDAVTGDISLAAGVQLDYETDSLHSFYVIGTNFNGTSVAQEVVIRVLDVNEAPQIENQEFFVNENSPIGTVVGQLQSTDPENNQYYVSLSSSSQFAVDSNGVITVIGGPLDFETEPSIEFEAVVTDGEFSDTAVITIQLVDVNEAPAILTETLHIAENSPQGTLVGVIEATDPEGDELTYTLLTNNSPFIVTPSGEVIVQDSAALDFESTTSFTIQVQVTDGEFTHEATIQIELTDVNEAPYIITETLEVQENSPKGTIVGIVEAKDPEGDELVYTIMQPDSPFSIDSKGVLKVTKPDVLDFETNPVWQVIIEVKDVHGLGSLDTITVNLENVIETTDVKIIEVISKDSVWKMPDTIYTSLDTLEVIWTKGTQEISDLEIITKDGVHLVIRTWKDETSDLPGSDTIVVIRNSKPPVISYPHTIPELPKVPYLVTQAEVDNNERTKDEKVIFAPLIKDGKPLFYVNNPDTVFTASVSYMDKNQKIIHTTIEAKTQLKQAKAGHEEVINEVVFSYTDVYGNTVQDTILVVLDTKPPVVKIVSPVDNTTTKNYVVDVQWMVDGELITMVAQQSLEEGSNVIIRSFMDRAGNVTSDTVVIELEARNKSVIVSLEEPLIKMDEKKIAQMYALNPPEKNEVYALSILNMETGTEQELQFGSGANTRKAKGEEPYPGMKGQHIGPTLRIEIKVPHMGGLDAAGNPRGGDITSMMMDDGLIYLDGQAGDVDEVGLTISDYVSNHCLQDAFDDVPGQDVTTASLSKTTISLNFNLYDNLGQFVDRYILEQPITGPDVISDAGMVTMYLELKPDEARKLRNQLGRSLGTGAYILRGVVRSNTQFVCDTPDGAKGSTQRKAESISQVFGYTRR